MEDIEPILVVFGLVFTCYIEKFTSLCRHIILQIVCVNRGI